MASKFVAAGVASAVGVATFFVARGNKRHFLSPDDPQMPQNRTPVPPSREECMAKLLEATNWKSPLDVLVIGGGATGTGIVLDLATRGGIRVGLVEADDYASETSSRSSKLIHGGVRYLEKAVFQLDPQQLRLVFEALRERAVMLHQAPHLSSPLATIIPCYSPFDVVLYWCGMKVYDLLALLGKGTIGGYSKFQLPVTTLNNFPKLKHEKEGSTLLGSIVYYDGEHNDARFCLAVALTAACFGAAVVNHCRVSAVQPPRSELPEVSAADEDSIKDPSAPLPPHVGEYTKDQLVEVTITDQLTGKQNIIYTKAVVNAAGPFSDSIRTMVNPKHQPVVCPAGGTHITLPEKYGPRPGQAMVVPSSDGRVLFMINWLGHCIAGTTDSPCDVTPAPRGSEEEVKWILESMREFTGKVPREEVLSVWCGIRPLSKPPGSAKGNTQNIVREHFIQTDVRRRMLSITGGKWTTYRKMAEDAVDALIEKGLLDPTRLERRNSVTAELRLWGAEHLEDTADDLTLKGNVPLTVSQHWERSYGDQVSKVFAIANGLAKTNEARNAKSPTTPPTSNKNSMGHPNDTGVVGLGEDESKMALPFSKLYRLCPSLPITDADVIFSCRSEHAETVQDIISRRSRMAFLNREETLKYGIPRVAEIMAKERHWSKDRVKQETEKATAYMNTFTAVSK